MAGLPRVEKFIFDLAGNALQPIFGTKSAVLKMPKLSLQFLYTIFGGSKLHRKAVCDTQSAAAVLFRSDRRLLKQSQNGLSGAIQRIAVIRMAILRSWRKGNDVFGLALATLSHRYPLQKSVKFRCSLARSNL
jgi:hypothetical protein